MLNARPEEKRRTCTLSGHGASEPHIQPEIRSSTVRCVLPPMHKIAVYPARTREPYSAYKLSN